MTPTIKLEEAVTNSDTNWLVSVQDDWLDSVQEDVNRLASTLDAISNDTTQLLGIEQKNAKTKTRISSFTIILAIGVVVITFLLNISLLKYTASNSQLLACNIGMGVLFVLVSMCIMSDLARGRSHFQNERGDMKLRIDRVCEQLRSLLIERREWAGEIVQCQFSADTEKLKLQFVRQEIDSHQEKLDLTRSLIETCEQLHQEKQTDLATAEKSLSDARTASHQLELEQKERQSLLRDLEIEIDSTKASKEKLASELENSQTSIVTSKLALEELERKRLELLLVQEELENQVVATRSELDALLERSKNERQVALQLEEERSRNQRSNIEIVNSAMSLERQVAQQQEAISQGEAKLRSIEEAILKSSENLRDLAQEKESVDIQVCSLLNQIGELERLQVAKTESELEKQNQDAADSSSVIEACKLQELAAREAIETILEEQEARLSALDSLRQEEARLVFSLKELRGTIEIETTKLRSAHEDAALRVQDAEKTVVDASRRVEMLTEKANSLAEQVQLRSAELYSHKQDLRVVREEVRELEAIKKSSIDVSKELEELQDSIAYHKTESDAILEQIASFETTLSDKQLTLTALQKHSDDLDLRMTEARVEVTNAKAELDLLGEHKAELIGEVEVMEQRLAAISSLHASALCEIEESQTALEQRKDEMEGLAKERDLHLQDIDELKKNILRLQTEVSSLDSDSQRVLELTQIHKRIEDEIANATNRLEDLQRQQHKTFMEVDSQSRGIEEGQKRLAQLNSELREVELLHTEKLAILTDSDLALHKLSEQREIAESQLELIQTRTKEAELVKAGCIRQAEDLEKECATATDLLRQISEEVSESQGIAQQWTAYVANLKKECAVQEKAKTDLETILDQLRDQRSDVATELRRIETLVDETNQELSTLQERSKEEARSIRSMERELEERIAARDLATRDCGDAKRELLDVEDRVEQAKRSLQDYQQTLSKEQAKLLDFEKAQADWLRRIEELKEDCHDKQADLDELQLAYVELVNEKRAADLQIDQARKEIAALEGTQERLQLFKVECQQYQQKLVSVMGELETREIELNDVEDSLIAKEHESERLQLEIDQKRLEIKSLESARVEWKRIENEHWDREAKLSQLELDLRLRQSELNAMDEEMVNRKEESIETDKQIEKARAEIESLSMTKDQLNQLEGLCQQRQLALEEIDADIATRNADLTQLDQSFLDLNAKATELQKHIKAEQLEIESLGKVKLELQQLQLEYAEKQQSLGSFEVQVRDKQQELQASVSNLEAVQMQFSQLNLQMKQDSDHAERLKRQVSTNQRSAEELEHRLEQAQREMTKLASLRKATENSISELMDVKERLQLETREHRQQIEEMRRESKQDIEKKLVELASIENQISAKRSQEESLHAAIESLNQQLQVMQSSLERSNDSLEAEIQATLEEVQSLSESTLAKAITVEEQRPEVQPTRSSSNGLKAPMIAKRDAWDAVFTSKEKS